MKKKPTYQDLIKKIEELNKKIQQLKSSKTSNQVIKYFKDCDERYKSFVSNFHGIAFCGDFNFKPLFFHGNVEAITAYKEDDFLSGKVNWKNIIHPDDIIELFQKTEKIYTEPNILFENEYRIILKDGKIKWVRQYLKNICDKSGKPVFIDAVLYDITEQKETENALKESEIRFRNLLENLPNVAVQGHRPDGTIFYWNKANELIYGYTAEEAIGENLLDLIIPPEMKEDVRKTIRHSIKTKKIIPASELELLRKDRTRVPVFSGNALIMHPEKEIEMYSIDVDLTELKKAKKALYESEKKFEKMIESSLDAIMVIDNNGNITYWNKAAEKIFGYLKEEIKNKELHKLLVPERDFIKYIIGFQKFAKTGKGRVLDKILELSAIKKDGTEIQVEVTVSTILIKGKWNAVGTVRDITERKKTEKIQNVLYEIANASNTTDDLGELFKSIHNHLGEIVDTTNFFIALLNKKTGMITLPYFVDEKDSFSEFPIGKSVTSYIIRNNKSILLTKEDLLKLEQSGEIERKGTYCKVLLGVPLLKGREVVGAVVVQSYKDASLYSKKDLEILKFVSDQIALAIDRKKIEEELRYAKQKAEEADKLKSAFLANMSHEIRTPMNTIIGFSELLLDKETSDEEKENYSRFIHKSGNNLLHLIDDIIDISKIEANQIAIYKSQCFVNQVLKELQATYENEKNIQHKNHIELRLIKSCNNENFSIITDPYRFRQIFSNLLGNSIKFTEHGFIEFGYTFEPDTSTDTEKQILQFYVKDTGIGIAKDKQDIIFDRFGKIYNANKKNLRGTGLGLSISKHLVKLLGGEIWFKSVINKGSTFYFTLPFESDQRTITKLPLKKKTKLKYDWTDKVFLIVEDIESNYMFFKAILKKTNANILWAQDGKQAVNICKLNNNINIVLMDIKLPIMDGYEAAYKIRKFRKKLIIIAQTALQCQEKKKKALKPAVMII
ncbi:MAG: PAS domain S-box protein [Bacteroidales bacterium]|nr:PAS domain S-box protein [Bacteroidales bacterium]